MSVELTFLPLCNVFDSRLAGAFLKGPVCDNVD